MPGKSPIFHILNAHQFFTLTFPSKSSESLLKLFIVSIKSLKSGWILIKTIRSLIYLHVLGPFTFIQQKAIKKYIIWLCQDLGTLKIHNKKYIIWLCQDLGKYLAGFLQYFSTIFQRKILACSKGVFTWRRASLRLSLYERTASPPWRDLTIDYIDPA